MRIILINQFFGADMSPTGQLLSDVAAFLSAQGIEVLVLCGKGAYTADASAGGAAQWPSNVEVRYVPSLGFGRGFRRPFSYASFLCGTLLTGLLVPKADVVVTLTSPPMLPVIGMLLKLLRHRKHFIWEMDLFPDALVDVGYSSKNSLAIRGLGYLADLARKRSDGVIVLGECMRQRLLGRGIPASQLFLGENWADGRMIHPLPFLNERPALKVLYSGNLGLTHDTETILAAMTQLKNHPDFEFRFAGSGEKRTSLRRECEALGIDNAEFTGYCKKEDLVTSLASGDVGLVTQLESCEGTVVPSKVYTLLAAGRPVLFVGPRDAMPGRIVRKHRCGWQIDAGDDGALVELLRSLQANPAEVRAAGERGREAFLAHYDLPHGVSRIGGILGVTAELRAGRAAAAAAAR